VARDLPFQRICTSIQTASRENATFNPKDKSPNHQRIIAKDDLMTLSLENYCFVFSLRNRHLPISFSSSTSDFNISAEPRVTERKDGARSSLDRTGQTKDIHLSEIIRINLNFIAQEHVPNDRFNLTHPNFP
jgi:hypothetical protein